METNSTFDRIMQEIDLYKSQSLPYVFWCLNDTCKNRYDELNNANEIVKDLTFAEKYDNFYCDNCKSCLINKGLLNNETNNNSYKFAYSNLTRKVPTRLVEYGNKTVKVSKPIKNR